MTSLSGPVPAAAAVPPASERVTSPAMTKPRRPRDRMTRVVTASRVALGATCGLLSASSSSRRSIVAPVNRGLTGTCLE